MKGQIVLVQWDEAVAQERACTLRTAGWFVQVESASEQEALHVIAVDQPDAVIIDLVAQPERGMAVARLLRQDSRTAALPVVFVDGSAAHDPEAILTTSAGLGRALEPFAASDSLTTGDFWEKLDRLVASSQIIIDRPKGSRHPHYLCVIYPLDYGYLSGTTSGDGGGIDVWVGSLLERRVMGVICTVDLEKRDAEIKVLLGCTPDEIRQALEIHNAGSQSGLLALRPAHTQGEES